MVVVVEHGLGVDGYEEVLLDVVVAVAGHVDEDGGAAGLVADLARHVQRPQVAVYGIIKLIN